MAEGPASVCKTFLTALPGAVENEWSSERHTRCFATARIGVVSTLVMARRSSCPLSLLPLELLHCVFEWLWQGARDYSIAVAPQIVDTGDRPVGVAVTSTGRIVVTTFSPFRVLVFGPDLCQEREFDAATSRPEGVAVDDAGNIFLTDLEGKRIVVVRDDGCEVASFGTEAGPSGVAIGRDGNIFVADGTRVQVFTRDGAPVRAFKATYPVGVAVSSGGDIAVIGWEHLYLFSADGTHVRTIGDGDGPVKLCRPTGVAFDHAGNIVVTDSIYARMDPRGHDRVLVFHPGGALLWQTGLRGSGLGEFHFPYGVAVAPDERIVVADFENRRIQLV